MDWIVEPRVERYAEEHSDREPEHLREVARATREVSDQSGMMIGRLEGRVLRMLARLVRAERILEIGTFTGYSALSMAEALPPSGRIVTCELDPERAAMARRHIEQAGYADMIEVRVGPALETLHTLSGPFDLVFIDADKPGYIEYYEAALPLLAPGGLMVADNVLWSGRVVEGDTGRDTEAITAFNDHVADDPRVERVILPLRDGVSLIMRATTGTEGA